VPRRSIERIRALIRQRQYDLTAHAIEEAAEDELDIVDVERAVLGGEITRMERDDPRGTKYVIEGPAAEGVVRVGVVGRFTGTGRYLIITVYAIHQETGGN